jgi:hypothetical protein
VLRPISDKESVQVYYDSSHKVIAIAVTYLAPIAPEPKSVLGTEADDGFIRNFAILPSIQDIW